MANTCRPTSIHWARQWPITCNLCEVSEDVDSFCLMCKGPMCATCKVNHIQTPMFQKHKIVPIIEGLKIRAAEEECTTHPSYALSMHCNVCHELICNKCISSGKHIGHDIGEVKAAVQRVQQEIKEYHDTLKNTYLAKYRKEQKDIMQIMTDYKKLAMSRKSDINDQRAELIKEVHRVCDDLISEADKEEKQQSIQADKSLKKVQERIEEIELLMTQSMEALKKLASKLIKFNQEKPSLSHLHEDVKETLQIHPSTFISGTVNRQKMAVQIGKLISPKHLPSIIHRHIFDKGIYYINPVDGNKALVTTSDPRELQLVDTDGKVVKCINTKFNIDDFAVTTSGEIIVTNYDGGFIRILTQTGQVTKTINTNPSKPSGVCLVNNNQRIVVCVTLKETFSKLAVYSRDGKKICNMSYTNRPMKKYKSQRVTQNNKGDYCVAHYDHNKVYAVVELDGLTMVLVLGRT